MVCPRCKTPNTIVLLEEYTEKIEDRWDIDYNGNLMKFGTRIAEPYSRTRYYITDPPVKRIFECTNCQYPNKDIKEFQQ